MISISKDIAEENQSMKMPIFNYNGNNGRNAHKKSCPSFSIFRQFHCVIKVPQCRILNLRRIFIFNISIIRKFE